MNGSWGVTLKFDVMVGQRDDWDEFYKVSRLFQCVSKFNFLTSTDHKYF